MMGTNNADDARKERRKTGEKFNVHLHEERLHSTSLGSQVQRKNVTHAGLPMVGMQSKFSLVIISKMRTALPSGFSWRSVSH